MPGRGKYTRYVARKSAKRDFTEKLFAAAPFNGLDDAQAPEFFAAMGNQFLIPSQQEGQSEYFPQGVSLDYKHPDAPNLDDVRWTKRGDAANPYHADLRSPGPGPDGQINVVPNDTDPEISPADTKPNYVPGVPGTAAEGGTGTVDPDVTSPKIASNVVLGRDFSLGSSQKS